MLALMLACSTLSLFAAFVGQNRITAKGLDEYGLSLIAPTSSDFPQLLRRAVGKSQFRELETILPYSVLLVNTSKKRVVFYSVRWESTSSKGVLQHDDRMYYNFSTLRGGYTVDPGAVWLVSVIDALNKPLKPDSQNEFAHKFQQSRMDLQFQQQSNVAISLDVVIFSNGEVVGPNRSGSMEHAQARLDSARDLHAAFEDRVTHHHSVQSFVARLHELKKGPGAVVDQRPNKWYAFYTRQLAGELIGVYEQSGEAALRERVQQTCRTSIQLHR